MKFRALAKQHNAINYIIKSLQTATKLGECVVFRLAPDGMQLISNPSYKNGQSLSRGELLKGNIFVEYGFNGVSPEHNLIYFDVLSEALGNVIHSIKLNNIKSLKFKLVNGRNRKFILAITVEYSTLSNVQTVVKHDVYVSIIQRKFWGVYEDHMLATFQVMFLFIMCITKLLFI